jgi:hypothetical protein
MFVTVDDLAKYTKLKTDDLNDLQSFLDSACNIVKNYLGYDPAMGLYTDYTEGFGSNRIKLKHKPISLVYKITDYETDEIIFEAQQSLKQDYIISEEFVTFKNIVFPMGHHLIVEYIGGYGLLNFTPSSIIGGNALTLESDFDKIIFGGDAIGFTDIFNEINGGNALTLGIIENNNLPPLFKQTVLRIATLLISESDNNIGVSSKTFGDSGSRTFINYVNFDKYLLPLSQYKIIVV